MAHSGSRRRGRSLAFRTAGDHMGGFRDGAVRVAALDTCRNSRLPFSCRRGAPPPAPPPGWSWAEAPRTRRHEAQDLVQRLALFGGGQYDGVAPVGVMSPSAINTSQSGRCARFVKGTSRRQDAKAVRKGERSGQVDLLHPRAGYFARSALRGACRADHIVREHPLAQHLRGRVHAGDVLAQEAEVRRRLHRAAFRKKSAAIRMASSIFW